MQITGELVQSIVNYLGKREEVVLFQILLREIQTNRDMKETENAAQTRSVEESN